MRAVWSPFGYKCYSKNTVLYRQTGLKAHPTRLLCETLKSNQRPLQAA